MELRSKPVVIVDLRNSEVPLAQSFHAVRAQARDGQKLVLHVWDLHEPVFRQLGGLVDLIVSKQVAEFYGREVIQPHIRFFRS